MIMDLGLAVKQVFLLFFSPANRRSAPKRRYNKVYMMLYSCESCRKGENRLGYLDRLRERADAARRVRDWLRGEDEESLSLTYRWEKEGPSLNACRLFSFFFTLLSWLALFALLYGNDAALRQRSMLLPPILLCIPAIILSRACVNVFFLPGGKPLSGKEYNQSIGACRKSCLLSALLWAAAAAFQVYYLFSSRPASLAAPLLTLAGEAAMAAVSFLERMWYTHLHLTPVPIQ